MAQSKADVVDLIGLPFKDNTRGPDKYDCYGVLMELMKRDGKPIPDFSVSDAHDLDEVSSTMSNNMHLWRSCDKKPGCGILFRIKGYGSHVGYLLADGRNFIHAWEHSGGVTIEPLRDWQHRVIGFYEYIG